MTKPERITLVGGPGDGLEFSWLGGDALHWRPTEDRDHVLACMHARAANLHEPIEYRRSRRTRTLFVYQP